MMLQRQTRLLIALALFLIYPAVVRGQAGDPQARFADQIARALAEPYRGITSGGAAPTDLFKVRSTGVSTAPVREAAAAFLDGLSETQRQQVLFPVDDIEWRKWDNRHFYQRQGISFQDMSSDQRQRAMRLLQQSLSAKGLQQTRDIMRLNGTLAELTGKPDEYGQWLYWITVMGEPSATQPWGWQLDGHHCVINYFVLGDQVVMTPVFMGSEPVKATSGAFAGTEVLQAEQQAGLRLMKSLDQYQQHTARIRNEKGPTNTLAEAFHDNLDLEATGICACEFDDAQQDQLLQLIGLYVGNLRDGHARVKMDEVAAHLKDTYFAWIGGTDADSVFYYRIQSPVILIEFDHQRPIALGRSQTPTRNHIHTVVRTPNGNDYGKDLLRQHYQQHPHP